MFISEVVRGGAAELDGRLMQGDQILSINGDDMKHASQETVAAILKVNIHFFSFLVNISFWCFGHYLILGGLDVIRTLALTCCVFLHEYHMMFLRVCPSVCSRSGPVGTRAPQSCILDLLQTQLPRKPGA